VISIAVLYACDNFIVYSVRNILESDLLNDLDFLSDARIRILVIDDTQKNLEIVGQLLSANGYHVTAAGGGERGIAIANKLLPDLDVMMPDIDGYSVCRKLKGSELTKDIPVIFLTAKTEHEDLMEGFNTGAVDYITKPFVKEELLIRVSTHAELARKRNQQKMLSSLLDKYVLEIIIDMRGNVRHVSRAFLELTEYEEEDILGNSFEMFKHPDSFRSELSEILDSVKNNFIYYKEIKLKRKNGSKCVINVFVEPVTNMDGMATGAQCFMTDVTSRKELEHLSITDKLTDLFNRQKLDEVLNYEFSQSTRYGSHFSVVLLDLDDFKNINDTLGHLVGDEVLIKVAEILKKNVRDTDTAGRWGGEEFLLIIPKASEDEAAHVAEKLRASAEGLDFGIGRKVTVSAGVGSTDGSLSLRSLLSLTDKAMYKAKKEGKNRVALVSELKV